MQVPVHLFIQHLFIQQALTCSSVHPSDINTYMNPSLHSSFPPPIHLSMIISVYPSNMHQPLDLSFIHLLIHLTDIPPSIHNLSTSIFPSIQPPNILFMYLSICSSFVCPSSIHTVHVYIQHPFHQYQFIHPFMHLSNISSVIKLSIFASIHLFVNPSNIYPSSHPKYLQFVYPSIYSFIPSSALPLHLSYIYSLLYF